MRIRSSADKERKQTINRWSCGTQDMASVQQICEEREMQYKSFGIPTQTPDTAMRYANLAYGEGSDTVS
ncbi:MAG: hypothetical protein J6C09_08575 [Clostridia bacterium]|nr:hypothetical protein [Clostridia bacterium]